MRVLLLLLVVGALALAPFVAIRRPWALRIWQRVKFFVILYVLVIFASAVFWLITRWDDFYG